MASVSAPADAAVASTTSLSSTSVTRMSFDWPTDPGSYELLGKIGRGAFATVWKARPTTTTTTSDSNGYYCAIKILNLDHVDSDWQEIRREVQAMRLSSHANVIPLYEAFLQGMHLWLVTTLMRKGSSLHCLLTARRNVNCPARNDMERHIFYILHQSLMGLSYIHSNQQMHRDIKGGNILIDSDGSVKLADFGVSQVWLDYHYPNAAHAQARTFVGTPCWMAPEVMEQDAATGYDSKADVWSLGITALELAKGFAPYAKYPPMKVLILTLQEEPPSLDTYLTLEETGTCTVCITEQYSKIFSQFIDQCLQKNPARRPSCDDLLQHFKALQPMTNDAAYLQECRHALVTQVCDYVPDVGGNTNNDGSAAATYLQLQQHKSHEQVRIVMESARESRQKGTTWVFTTPDGGETQVLNTSSLVSTTRTGTSGSTGDDDDDNNNNIHNNNVNPQVHAHMNVDDFDDVLNQLEEFQSKTGGEHYHPQEQHQPHPLVAEEDEEEDMNDFLDNLEQTLPGEDFQREQEQTSKR